MEMRQLRYFLAVADAEQRLGLRLFDRHAKGVMLTDGGRVFEQEARRLVADFDAMQSRVGALARGHSGVLQVAFTSSAAAHSFTPQALRACRQRYPRIEWVVSESNAAEVTEGVVSGRLHCGFVRVPVARPEGVMMRTLLREPVVAALPLGHELSEQRTIRLKDFHEQPLILVRRPGAPGLYANLLDACKAAGAVPRVVAEVERMMTSVNLVAAGVGLTVVPASMKGAHGQAVVYRDLPRNVKLDAPLTLLYRADRLQGALANFVALVVELSREISARGRMRRDRPEPAVGD
jgi:DNA-binding transcriptional LysR family regulator